MKLEQQVVSLEYAKKLKELGVKQERKNLYFRGANDARSEIKLALDIQECNCEQ